MLEVKNLKNYKFKDAVGVYSTTGFALYEAGKGFVTLDGENPYSPRGGKKTLLNILNDGGLSAPLAFIQPI